MKRILLTIFISHLIFSMDYKKTIVQNIVDIVSESAASERSDPRKQALFDTIVYPLREINFEAEGLKSIYKQVLTMGNYYMLKELVLLINSATRKRLITEYDEKVGPCDSSIAVIINSKRPLQEKESTLLLTLYYGASYEKADKCSNWIASYTDRTHLLDLARNFNPNNPPQFLKIDSMAPYKVQDSEDAKEEINNYLSNVSMDTLQLIVPGFNTAKENMIQANALLRLFQQDFITGDTKKTFTNKMTEAIKSNVPSIQKVAKYIVEQLSGTSMPQQITASEELLMVQQDLVALALKTLQ